MLLTKGGPRQADNGSPVGKYAQHIASAADLPVKSLLGIVRPDLSSGFGGKRGKGGDAGARFFDYVGHLGKLSVELLHHAAKLGLHLLG